MSFSDGEFPPCYSLDQLYFHSPKKKAFIIYINFQWAFPMVNFPPAIVLISFLQSSPVCRGLSVITFCHILYFTQFRLMIIYNSSSLLKTWCGLSVLSVITFSDDFRVNSLVLSSLGWLHKMLSSLSHMKMCF